MLCLLQRAVAEQQILQSVSEQLAVHQHPAGVIPLYPICLLAILEHKECWKCLQASLCYIAYRNVGSRIQPEQAKHLMSMQAL